VEQIAEICCRLMSRGNCKEHKFSLVDRQWLGSTLGKRPTLLCSGYKLTRHPQ